MDPVTPIKVCAATGAVVGTGVSYLASYRVVYGAVAGALAVAIVSFVGSKERFQNTPDYIKFPVFAAYPLILGAVTHAFQKDPSLLKTALVSLTTLFGGIACSIFVRDLFLRTD